MTLFVNEDLGDRERVCSVFVYGSAINRSSLLLTVPDLHVTAGPFPAILRGWTAQWNVGSETASQPERVWTSEVSGAFAGVLVSLGLERGGASAQTAGAIYHLAGQDIAALDRRERDYDRLNVSDGVRWVAGPDPSLETFAYVPRPAAAETLRCGLAQGRAVLSSNYWGLVESALRSLSPQGLFDPAESLAELWARVPLGCRVEPLAFTSST
jgi:hypothetical protein